MVTLVAQIAPQRSTQYADVAGALAPHELALSPVGRLMTEVCAIRLGGRPYLRFDLSAAPDEAQRGELGALALSSGFFTYHERIGELQGPFLRPLETCFAAALPQDLLMARRYRGKTNEQFTHFLCNIARFSSGYADRPWDALSVFDPLAGGGTTLFAALTLGANAAGVERELGDVESTAAFLGEYLREHGVPFDLKQERLRKLGHRWSFAIGKATPRVVRQRCLLAHGETARSPELIAGFRPHLIVTDLPYGIQHHGPLVALLSAALPAWTSLLAEEGALVFSWDATRFPRPDMIALVESAAALRVFNQPPYDRLGHRVDRVIKQREVLVARRARSDQIGVDA